MVIGPDKGDAIILRRLCRETDSDVWFPCYPLCTEHCITETYAMAYECYRQMTEIYGGNISTCGFSSGGALALGIAAHNSALGAPLPQPRHIIAVSPGEVMWNDEETARMQALQYSVHLHCPLRNDTLLLHAPLLPRGKRGLCKDS